MKNVKCFIAIAAFALSMTACSGSRNSTSSGMGTTSPNSSSGTQGTGSSTTSPSGTGSTTDSSHLK